MGFRDRLSRVEGLLSAASRCPRCANRPAETMLIFRKDSPTAEAELQTPERDDGEPCPDCGWEPSVLKIVEVIIRDREELALLPAE